MRGRWILTGAGALSLLLISLNAWGYCLKKEPQSDPPFLAWTPVPANYQVSDTLTDAALLGAIEAAIKSWQDASCSVFTYNQGIQFPIDSVAFEHAQPYLYIFWHTTPWEKFVNPNNADQPYASYTFTYWNKTGGISGASIALNAVDYKWDAQGGASDTFDVQNELTHLIGSVIGLTYTPEAGHVMSEGLKFGDTARRILSQDDMDAMAYLYKEDGCAAAPEPDPNTGCSTGVGPVADSGGVVSDGGVTADRGTSTPSDGGGVAPGTEAGVNPGTDAGEGPVPEDDDGCCRVSHARSANLPFLVLIGLAVLLTLARRRR